MKSENCMEKHTTVFGLVGLVLLDLLFTIWLISTALVSTHGWSDAIVYTGLVRCITCFFVGYGVSKSSGNDDGHVGKRCVLLFQCMVMLNAGVLLMAFVSMELNSRMVKIVFGVQLFALVMECWGFVQYLQHFDAGNCGNFNNELNGAKEEPKRQRLEGLDGLRCFFIIFVILDHIAEHKGMVQWSGSGLTFFFCLSGFVLTYTYETKSFDSFLAKRFCRLYPLLWVSIVAVLPVLEFGNDYTMKEVVAVAFSYTAWDETTFTNAINTPSWFIGAIFFCYILFPTFHYIFDTSTTDSTRLYYGLPVLFILSLWQTANQMDVGFTVWYQLNKIIFKSHVPSFLFGMIIGFHYVTKKRDESENQPSIDTNRKSLTQYFGATFSFFTLLFVYGTVELESGFLMTWKDNGMLLPVMGLLIYSVADGYDLLAQILRLPFLKSMGQISFNLYIFQSCVKTYVVKYFCQEEITSSELPLSCWPIFFSILIAVGFLTQQGMTKQLSNLCMCSITFLSSCVQPVFSSFRNWSTNKTIKIKVAGYYLLLGGIIMLFIHECTKGDLGIINIDEPVLNKVIGGLKWIIMLGLPSLLFNLVGQLTWPAPYREKLPSLQSLLNHKVVDDKLSSKAHGHIVNSGSTEKQMKSSNYEWAGRIHIRIVTRGKNPNLVLSNAESAVEVLENSGLPSSRWRVEVVTDNALYLSQRSEQPITEILVPKEFVCPNGGKYKARALHYSIKAGGTTDEDWIIHLDEETQFDERTLTAIYKHCSEESKLVHEGEQKYGKIGQGVILYGSSFPIDNYVTTLADCVRVGDDFGKFRFQYQCNRPWIGMHGSFVVVNHCVERQFGFDHGIAGSITEDAYFALLAWSDDVYFRWIDAFMYEQSPFTCKDFIRQRARWFGGLYLVCRDQKIPFKNRAILTFTTCSWACAPFICIAMFLSLIFITPITYGFRICLAVSASLSCFGYVLGFISTFSLSHGCIRYFILLYFVLICQPFFAILEVCGILYTFYSPPSEGFYVVQKEQGKPNLSNCARLAITEEDLNNIQKHAVEMEHKSEPLEYVAIRCEPKSDSEVASAIESSNSIPSTPFSVSL